MIVDRRLLLIRHCQSNVDAARHPAAWELTESGTEDAHRLAQSPLFSSVAVVAAGDQPKMVESLRPLADRCEVELAIRPSLNESTRGDWVADSEYQGVVRRFLEVPGQAPAPGWESAETTVNRFLHEVEQLAVGEPAGDLVVCTGGRALTATLIQIGLVATDDAVTMWSTLQMPDIVVVHFDGRGEARLPEPADIESIPVAQESGDEASA